MAEDLLGRRVVETVSLSAHRLDDAVVPQPFPPKNVLVLPAHVGMQNRCRSGRQPPLEHAEQTHLLGHVGVGADVPGEYLLAGHVIDGSEIRLAASDLELGDIGAELLEGARGVEVPAEHIGNKTSRVSPVGGVPSPWIRPPDLAPQPHPAHELENRLCRHLLTELFDQAHVYLPMSATVGAAVEDLGDQRLQIGSGRSSGMGEVVVVSGTGQSRYPQQIGKPVSLPYERFDDRGPVSVADLDARRARTFPR